MGRSALRPHDRRQPVPGPVGRCRATGTDQYRSRDDARYARKRLRGRGLSAYQCDECSYWHLDHRASFHPGRTP